MPVVGIDETPRVFWLFYSAFEDSGLSKKPDKEAKDRIHNELATL